MTEFEFIEAISEGNLAKNDVIKYAEGVCDKRDLLENIFAYIVSLNTINYNPQNEAFAIPKRSVPIFGPLSKTKCLIFYKIRTAFRWTSNPI